MSRHLDKILANAERQLAATATKRPTDVLPLYKKFLKIEEHRLRLRHQAGGGGREICAGRAELIDVLLRHVFGQAKGGARKQGAASSIALMALGGYGRRELNPFSDVDVMLLHRQNAARGIDRTGSLSPLGHRFQGWPLDALDQRSDRAGQ
jgi:[protein-PII] uridylyltransferase